MADFEKKLSGEEVKFKYILLPRGRENWFPARGGFELAFGEEKFKAFLYRDEDKSMGSRNNKTKTYMFMIKFEDSVPDIFHYRKTLKFEGEDEKWKVEVIG